MTLPENIKVYLSKKQAAAKLGLSVRGLDKISKQHDDFPKPRVWGDKRQSRIRYLDSELDAWMDRNIQTDSTV